MLGTREREPSFRWRGRFVRRQGPAPDGQLVERVRRGFDFMTASPPLVRRDDSSTLRELWGVQTFVV